MRALAGQAGAIALLLVGGVLMLIAAFIAGAEAYGQVPALAVGGGILALVGLIAFLVFRRRSQQRAARQEALSLALAAGLQVLPLLGRSALRLLAGRSSRASLIVLGALAAYHLFTRSSPPQS